MVGDYNWSRRYASTVVDEEVLRLQFDGRGAVVIPKERLAANTCKNRELLTTPSTGTDNMPSP